MWFSLNVNTHGSKGSLLSSFIEKLLPKNLQHRVAKCYPPAGIPSSGLICFFTGKWKYFWAWPVIHVLVSVIFNSYTTCHRNRCLFLFIFFAYSKAHGRQNYNYNYMVSLELSVIFMSSYLANSEAEKIW